MKHISLFAGIGGAEEAMKQAGLSIETVAFSEIKNKTIQFYTELHGDCGVALGDIKSLEQSDIEALGEIDILTGGFPCQSFSRMGKQKGWDCPDLKEIVAAMVNVIAWSNPKYIVLENVSAVLQRPHGTRAEEFIDLIKKGGKEDAPYKYGVSIHIGNPRELGYLQSRTRMYIVFSRVDQPQWTLPTQLEALSSPQVFKIDKKADPNRNCYKIGAKGAEIVFGENGHTTFACVTARAAHSHCNRGTWIRHTDGSVRGATPDELCQLFGWKRKPKYEVHPHGISRATVYHGFGNSWHVGHAAAIFKTFPREVTK